MSASESKGPVPPPDLFTSLRNFWGVIVAILYTRLDLATLELEEEATRAVNLVVVVLSALMAIGMTIFFILFFIVATFWDDHRLLDLGLVSIFCAIGSLILVRAAHQMVLTRPKFLSQTLGELREVVEGLRAKVVKAEEPRP